MECGSAGLKVLVADDDEIIRVLISALLRSHGYDVELAADGTTAWEILRREDGPRIALLNWLMPGCDGVAICRAVRAKPELAGRHLILLTSRDTPEHVVEGLRAGANDYMIKPFNKDELLARIDVGAKIVQLQSELTQRVKDLEEALAKVSQLQGLLPICSYCKNVRDDKNYWRRVEDYLCTHANVRCSHGVCPKCWDAVVKPEFARAGITLPDSGAYPAQPAPE
jgi:phosphoserine phosphatase RsbU/P